MRLREEKDRVHDDEDESFGDEKQNEVERQKEGNIVKSVDSEWKKMKINVCLRFGEEKEQGAGREEEDEWISTEFEKD